MDGERQVWIDLAALAALVGTTAYALLGGADFGGGVWDLFAFGPRKREQRLAIQHAMGPVWEANHVWLVFVVVVLFTCFPPGYALLGRSLFLPFHLALLGIMLRGTSFVFRSYQSRQDEAVSQTSTWGVVFGIASVMTPLLLGTAFGMITEGHIGENAKGQLVLPRAATWCSAYSAANGVLALSTCAYLAAVYLTNETHGALRDDFRTRAIFAGTTTAILAGVVLVFAWRDADWFLKRLIDWRTLPIIAAGIVCFGGSAWSVFTRRYATSRLFAAGEIALLLLGWGVAQYPYLIYPTMTLADAAAPTSTLKFVVLSIPVGALVLVPSLWFLFRVFKSRRPHDP